MGLYGIKKSPENITLSSLEKFSKKQGLSSYCILDTGYCKKLKVSSQSLSEQLKNFTQPLQIRVYDGKKDSMLAMVLNCNVGGFPNLNWKKYAKLDSVLLGFPQRLDSGEKYSQQLGHLRDKELKKIAWAAPAEKEVFVYYSVFMHRQSKRLLSYVRREVAKHDSTKVNIRVVHCDFLYSDYSEN
ncbi:MAG: hypothetical protein MUF75_10230 [Bacteroidia bacterium]|jgi:hypothetical protein|nr:hypothetical protein [Bacteroidia bacterium]